MCFLFFLEKKNYVLSRHARLGLYPPPPSGLNGHNGQFFLNFYIPSPRTKTCIFLADTGFFLFRLRKNFCLLLTGDG